MLLLDHHGSLFKTNNENFTRFRVRLHIDILCRFITRYLLREGQRKQRTSNLLGVTAVVQLLSWGSGQMCGWEQTLRRGIGNLKR